MPGSDEFSTPVSVPLDGVPDSGLMAAFIDVGALVNEKVTVPVDAKLHPLPSLISAVAMMSWGSPTPLVALAGVNEILASTNWFVHVLLSLAELESVVLDET